MSDEKPLAVIPRYTRTRIPVELRARLQSPTYMPKAGSCGYCATGHHDSCKRAIRSGDGHIILCPCTEFHDAPAAQQVRCTECNNDSIDELDEKLWLCWEKEDCENRINERLAKSPTLQLVHQAYLDADVRRQTEAVTKPARNRNPARASKGECLCCGEATKGGLFLPGHDARLVSQTAARVAEGADPAIALQEFKDLGVSSALVGKLERKLERM